MRLAAVSIGLFTALACVLRAQDLSAPTAVPGTDWKIQQSWPTAPNSTAVVLTVQPSVPVLVGGDSIWPRLVLRCRSGVFTAYVAAATVLEVTPDGSTFIRLRWNHDSTATVRRWPGSASWQAVFAPDPVGLVESLIRSDTLRLAFVPQNQPAVEAAFAVAGLATPAIVLAQDCPNAGLARVVPSVPQTDRVVAAADTAISTVTLLAWDQPPDYPDAMLHVRASGTVVVQFVLDTTGRPVSPTLKAIRFTEPAYAVYAVNLFRQGRFTPATMGGRKVRVLAEDTFTLTWLLGCTQSERITCYEFRVDDTLRVSRAP